MGNLVRAHRLAQARGHRFANIIEMWRIAADHRAETNQRVEFAAGRHFVSNDGNFECPGNAHHRQISSAPPWLLKPSNAPSSKFSVMKLL